MGLNFWERKLADVLKVSQHSQLRSSEFFALFCTLYTLIIFDFQHVFSNFFLFFTVCWQIPHLSILPFPAGPFNRGQYDDGCYKSWCIRLKVLALGRGPGVDWSQQSTCPDVESRKHITYVGGMYAGTYLQPQEIPRGGGSRRIPRAHKLSGLAELVSCGQRKTLW